MQKKTDKPAKGPAAKQGIEATDAAAGLAALPQFDPFGGAAEHPGDWLLLTFRQGAGAKATSFWALPPAAFKSTGLLCRAAWEHALRQELRQTRDNPNYCTPDWFLFQALSTAVTEAHRQSARFVRGVGDESPMAANVGFARRLGSGHECFDRLWPKRMDVNFYGTMDPGLWMDWFEAGLRTLVGPIPPRCDCSEREDGSHWKDIRDAAEAAIEAAEISAAAGSPAGASPGPRL